ncbi:hypothetical protein BCR35DRAFT_267100 [Leucosporidium creatinivorum]|uniref:Core-binding (CB) domain-containing protein n=1 Tax=Leucosporidium creatinivorum TaxID=106004 RepID=A0A1Y2F1C7_9BASI|nr:hypothetical protein BCR35DRAFT_267100 [Leucosporidium creatinivorum]
MLVDTPTFQANWSRCSNVKIEDRLNPEFAESLAPEIRLFFLFPILDEEDDITFTDKTLQSFIDTISYSWTRKTALAKGGHLLKYLEFCRDNKIEPKNIFPSTFKIVYKWLATYRGKIRAKTVANYLTTIRSWHAVHGVEFIEHKDQWGVVYRGLQRFQPKSRKPKIPVSIADLLAIEKHLDMMIPAHVAQWTASKCMFFGMIRGGSVMQKSQTSFEPKFDVKRSDVTFTDPTDPESPFEGATIHIPWDKVEGTTGRDYHIVKGHKDHVLDPVAGLKLFFALTPDVPPDAPLFSVRNFSTGGLHHLTSSKFRSRMNACLQAAKRPHLTGHGFRKGGATYFLKKSKNPTAIKMLGGWKSDAFEVYWGDKTALARTYLGVDDDEEEGWGPADDSDDEDAESRKKRLSKKRVRIN